MSVQYEIRIYHEIGERITAALLTKSVEALREGVRRGLLEFLAQGDIGKIQMPAGITPLEVEGAVREFLELGSDQLVWVDEISDGSKIIKGALLSLAIAAGAAAGGKFTDATLEKSERFQQAAAATAQAIDKSVYYIENGIRNAAKEIPNLIVKVSDLPGGGMKIEILVTPQPTEAQKIGEPHKD